MRLIAAFVFAFAIACPHSLFACLWDYDTLAVERSTVPGTHELIVGYFPRHGKDFYHWRVENRLSVPLAQRTPQDYNDIAVAYDKLGLYDKAIETINQKLERWPEENLYESKANLGTFLIHSGKLQEGLVHLEKAIAINPEAHFGREEYQILLVQYLIDSADPSQSAPSDSIYDAEGFAAYVLSRQPTTDVRNASKVLQKATAGISGMIRFGNHDSPILLEALGDLLWGCGHDRESSNKRLACRAYLMATRYTNDSQKQIELKEKALRAIKLVPNVEVSDVSALLDVERIPAQELQRSIETDEATWIQSGADVDEAFVEKYLTSKLEYELPGPTHTSLLGITSARTTLLLILVSLFLASLLALAAFVAIQRRDKKHTEPGH